MVSIECSSSNYHFERVTNSCKLRDQQSNINCNGIWTVEESMQYIFNEFIMNTVNSIDDDVQDATMLVTGGLQQYLIKHRPTNILPQPRKGCGSDTTTFHDLPDSIQLHIFSFLDAKHLCRIATVCQHWESLGLDEILWQRRLTTDIKHWHVIGHMSNPDAYREDDEELTTKEIYIRCSPMVRQMTKQSNFFLHRLSGIFRSLWPYKTPKLAMFGPGLESSSQSGSNLVRNMIEGRCEKFKVVAMFPGQFEGVGGGFTIQMSSILTFDLITLYTATKQERERQSPDQRAQNNRLLVHGPSDPSNLVEAELQPAVRELCRTLDGIIFVTDSTYSTEDMMLGRSELLAMSNEKWLPLEVSLLVLSCIPDVNSTTLPCIKIARLLQLQKFTRPWQVHDCIVDGMHGCEDAFQWIVEACRRK